MWGALINQYVEHLQAGGKSAETIRTRLSYMRRWARFCPDPDEASRLKVDEWMAGHSWAPETRKSARGALVSFYSWYEDRHGAGPFGLHRLDPITVPPGVPRPAQESAVQAGMGAADDATRLMVQLAARCGLRRGEVCRARREDIVGGWLYVTGKGGRVRRVPLPDDLRRELLARPAGFIFPGGTDGHLHPATVQKRVKCATGVPTHSFRHRYASRVYGTRRDLLAVQTLLGHTSPDTTKRYVLVDDDRLRETTAGI